ncbi:MAG: low molecular weight phosphotyrosine protein phosphatase [Balneolales bacterium]|nr:low molecular weight phosphotyrosine protein phosphatase [Balneolales bacterium]
MKSHSELFRPFSSENPYKVLFICLGNICRSPTAEGIFQQLVKDEGLGELFEIDSAGTSAFHEGQPANSKSRQIAEKHGVQLLSRSRPVRNPDYTHYDMLITMDHSVQEDMLDRSPGTDSVKSKIFLLRDFDTEPEDGQVPDPYYGGIQGFEQVFGIIDRSCRELLNALKPFAKL